MAKHGYRVVYGEQRPAWEQTFKTKREADKFAIKHLSFGDIIFNVAKVVPGEPPRSIMAAVDAAQKPKRGKLRHSADL